MRINEDLFDDRKDAEIAALRCLIENFKRYDEKRKQFYAKKMRRLGELESFVQEMTESKHDKNDLEKEVVKLKAELSNLSRAMQVRRIEEKRSPEELKEIINLDTLKRQNKAMKSQIKTLHATNGELLMKVMQLEKKLKDKETATNEDRTVDIC